MHGVGRIDGDIGQRLKAFDDGMLKLFEAFACLRGDVEPSGPAQVALRMHCDKAPFLDFRIAVKREDDVRT